MILYTNIDKIVSTTHDTVNKLLEYKNWPDALALYFRYIQQSKMQENNTTYSNDSFMIKATWRGTDRFRNAKNILKEVGLIELILIRWDNGQMQGKYIKVNFIISTIGGDNHPLEIPSDGETATNTLVVNKNTLVVNKNTLESGNCSINNIWGVAVNSPAVAEKFEEFRKIYPNKQGKAKARIYWSKIDPILYDRIIYAVRMYKSEKREIKYYKHADARLFQQSWEDYTEVTRADLKAEMDATWTRAERPWKYWLNLKPKYEAMYGDDWYDIRLEDKWEIKRKREALRREHRLSHNGVDLQCP